MESSSNSELKNQPSTPPPPETTTITLRPFTLADVDDYMVWAADTKVTKFCSWEPYSDKQDLVNFITHTVLPHPWFRAICLDGRPIGGISVTPSSSDRCKAELGYVLASEHWGKGIATRAVRMTLGTVFGEVEGLERVEALVDVENAGSQKVLEKVGFLKEGVMRKYVVMKGRTRDMVMYSFLDSDTLLGD